MTAWQHSVTLFVWFSTLEVLLIDELLLPFLHHSLVRWRQQVEGQAGLLYAGKRYVQNPAVVAGTVALCSPILHIPALSLSYSLCKS